MRIDKRAVEGGYIYTLKNLDTGLDEEVSRREGERLFPVHFRALKHTPKDPVALTAEERREWARKMEAVRLHIWSREWHAAVGTVRG